MSKLDPTALRPLYKRQQRLRERFKRFRRRLEAKQAKHVWVLNPMQNNMLVQEYQRNKEKLSRPFWWRVKGMFGLKPLPPTFDLSKLTLPEAL